LSLSALNQLIAYRELAEIEERLEEITVDEMLEKYPELAQEIKEEIEAGNWEKTDAGHNLSSEVTAA
jgi:DNA primase large subunit